MKRLLRVLCISIVVPGVFFFLKPHQSFAFGLPDGAPCVTNPIHSVCDSGFCKAATQIIPGLPGKCTPVATCTCDASNPHQYHCTLKNQTVTATCLQTGFAAFVCAPNSNPNQIGGSRPDVFNGAGIKGIKCIAGNPDHLSLGPPPSPPCATFDANGKCTSAITPFGNISTDPGKFISRLFGILLAASGMIALLLIMRAGYRFMTSRGNPEGIQQAREQLIAAIVGLLFLIFSFVILQVIGVDILGIPGASPSGSEAPR